MGMGPVGEWPGVIDRRISEFFDADPELDAAPPESIVKIHLGRLFGSLVVHDSTVILVLVGLAIVIWVVMTGRLLALFFVFPSIIGFGSLYVRRFTKSLRYTIASTPDGVRVGFGLLSTTSETLPPGRIHSIQVSQPLLRRPAGWWEITVNRASHSTTKGAAGQSKATILPVGDLGEVTRVLALLLPDLADVAAGPGVAAGTGAGVAAGASTAASTGTGPGPAVGAGVRAATSGGTSTIPPAGATASGRARHAADVVQPEGTRSSACTTFPGDAARSGDVASAGALIAPGLVSRGGADGFTNSPPRAVWLRPFSWRRNGFAITRESLLLRKGAIWRRFIIVPQPRLQSVSVRQGPLLRRLGLASVHLHTVAGPINAVLGALDQAVATRFFDDVARAAVASAVRDTSHRWRSGEAVS
jgi:membrane protein YdbS with pleckstrin-like domain